ncbi:MAG: hypothetical protein AAF203_00045 [Pseudomonadota bacterium]
MSRYEMSPLKAVLRLCLWTFFILGGMTGLNALIIVNKLGTDLFKPLSRNIASVGTFESERPAPEPAPTLEIDCRKKKVDQKIVTTAPNFRLVFKNCESIQSIKNLANHTEGDVFPINKKTSTSDFISLNLGENRIKTTIASKVHEFQVVRKDDSPATAANPPSKTKRRPSQIR